MAAESESRPEFESVSRVFCLESESELESKKPDSDSGPEAEGTTRQQTKILAEWLCIVLKTLKDRKKRSGSVDIKLKRPLMI